MTWVLGKIQIFSYSREMDICYLCHIDLSLFAPATACQAEKLIHHMRMLSENVRVLGMIEITRHIVVVFIQLRRHRGLTKVRSEQLAVPRHPEGTTPPRGAHWQPHDNDVFARGMNARLRPAVTTLGSPSVRNKAVGLLSALWWGCCVCASFACRVWWLAIVFIFYDCL